jgi:hypothetical protein
VVGHRPGEDLHAREAGLVLLVGDRPPCRQQAGQGRAGRKAAVATPQGKIHFHPGLARRLGNPAGPVLRPFAGSCMMYAEESKGTSTPYSLRSAGNRELQRNLTASGARLRGMCVLGTLSVLIRHSFQPGLRCTCQADWINSALASIFTRRIPEEHRSSQGKARNLAAEQAVALELLREKQ